MAGRGVNGEHMKAKFNFQRITGLVEITQAGLWVQWGGASFWSTAATGGLREAINRAVIEAREEGKAK